MKKNAFVFIIISSFIFSVKGQSKFEEILDMHFKAHHQDFWDEMNSVIAKGWWRSEHGDHFAEFYIKRGNKFLIKNNSERFLEAFDGAFAWTIGSWTDNKVKDLEPEKTLMLINAYDFGSPLSGIMEMDYKGKIEVDNIPCYWIQVMNKNQVTDYFISVETNLFYKSVLTDTWLGYERIVNKTVRKYRIIHRMNVATVIDIQTKNFSSEYAFDEIFLGEAIKESIFKKPENSNK